MKTKLKPCSGCDCETPCVSLENADAPFRTKEEYEDFNSEITGERLIAIIAKDNKNKCRECGGEAKPSNAIVNYHHIQRSYLRGEVEFETKMVDVRKCGDCGHSWT